VVALVNTIAKHANTFSGLRDLTFVCLLLDTGLRLSEALNLKLSDIDLSQGFVRVVGKGSKERFVPIGESVKVVLHRYLMRRMTVTNAGDWLFITTLATRLTKRQAHMRLSLWAKKAGIEGVRVSPHSLRFTFRSQVASKWWRQHCVAANFGSPNDANDFLLCPIVRDRLEKRPQAPFTD